MGKSRFTHRWRFLVAALGIVLAAVLICLAGLTLGDHKLDSQGVVVFDHAVQGWVHGLTGAPLTLLMRSLTKLGSILVFGTGLTCVFVWLLWQRRPHAALLLFLAMVGALGLNEGMKQHFHRDRPKVSWAIGDEHTYSYPSGHSLFAMVLYGTLVWVGLSRTEQDLRRDVWDIQPDSLRRAAALIVPAACLIFGIGFSRIYLGMHWPTDVLAGWCTGGVWLLAVVGIDLCWGRWMEQPIQPR